MDLTGATRQVVETRDGVRGSGEGGGYVNRAKQIQGGAEKKLKYLFLTYCDFKLNKIAVLCGILKYQFHMKKFQVTGSVILWPSVCCSMIPF